MKNGEEYHKILFYKPRRMKYIEDKSLLTVAFSIIFATDKVARLHYETQLNSTVVADKELGPICSSPRNN